MRTSPLGALTEPVRSWNPSREPDSEFDYIDLSAVDNACKTITGATALNGSEAPSRARQIVAAGDVLVSTVRPNLNAVAVVPPELDGATASTGFTVLRPSKELDAQYLFHWVRTPEFIADMVSKATGASYPAVSDRTVKASFIPGRPLPEQRRIAAILDHADALRAKRRQVLAHLEAMAESLFVGMFAGAPHRPLGEVVKFYSGATPPKGDPDLWDGDMPWFSAKDLKGTDLYDSIDHVTTETKGRLLPANTVAIVVRGMILAHSFPVSTLRVAATVNQDLKALIPVDDIQPDFLATALRAQKTWVLARVSTAAHGTRKLDSKTLEAIPIPNVSRDAQRRFGELVSTVNRYRVAQEQAHALGESLFASLQSRAFRGEL